jgi:membrane associated rhomboid family serine protease
MGDPRITSESAFVWRQILFALKLPFLLLMVLAGKRSSGELLNPFRDLFAFLGEAKATLVLIIINLAVFALEVFYLGPDRVLELAFQPADIVELNLLPIVASWFLHASAVHLLGNMLMLFIFGRIIERELGVHHLLLIYFGSAIISTLVSGFFGQGGIGASGAISGLIAAGIILRPFYLTYLVIGIPLPIIIVGWAGILADLSGVLRPTDDNIGHYAHLGGYAAISVLVFLLNQGERKKMLIGFAINALFITLLVFLYAFREQLPQQ